jgi:hypothetical protein
VVVIVLVTLMLPRFQNKGRFTLWPLGQEDLGQTLLLEDKVEVH